MLTNAPFPARHPLSASLWRQAPETLHNWLRALDKTPSPLLNHLAQTARNQLGRYHEALWHFALSQAPDIQLIAHNWVISEGMRTLGEMDFLIQDDEGLHHLEVAIKFYLAPSNGSIDAFDYKGPNAYDSLGAKIQRLSDHQLRLSEHPCTQALLAAKGLAKVQPSAWLTGTLFYPDQAPYWHYHSTWQPVGLWQELPRHRWLSPYQSDTLTPLTLEPTRAQMLVKTEQRQGRYYEQQRLLLLPDSWPATRAL